MLEGASITDVRVYAFGQPADKNEWIAVEILTDASVSGWGEAFVEPDSKAVIRALQACKQHLIGQNAMAAESIRGALETARTKHGATWDFVPGAINMALMDIMGKLTNAPTHQVLGGPTRNKARALAPLHGTTQLELVESLRQARECGFRSVSVPLPRSSRRTLGRRFYRDIRKLLEHLRDASDGQVDFVLNGGGQLTPAEATLLARELESFHLLWLDEPCGAIQNAALSGVSAETSTPIGLGRNVCDNFTFQDLLRSDAVDVIRPNILQWGVTSMRKAAALAETYYVAVAPTNSGGPIATAAALQVAAAIPNFFVLEIPLPANNADSQFRQLVAGADLEKVHDGFLSLPREPGLGVNVNSELTNRYKIEL